MEELRVYWFTFNNGIKSGILKEIDNGTVIITIDNNKEIAKSIESVFVALEDYIDKQ